ncbi:hypothetical protein ES332_D01G219400v1 [Gossypium tomentosum]|uniref:Uncharacterized protein n=1 Tax=Gossypium tomentosum TaxID=34277 RepID=A0A5D2MC96_GOSTO|nr:hypothetical protein ES332_D01G219400v1 [Gossypium tomentosum]
MFAEARISLFVFFFPFAAATLKVYNSDKLWIPGSNILESGVNPRVPFLVKVVFFFFW